jgi:hypothetical protein
VRKRRSGPPVYLADLVDRHHAFIGDARCGLPLLAETAHPLLVLPRGQMGQAVHANQLQGDETPGAGLLGQIDDPDAAAAQLADDVVPPELTAGGQVGRCGRPAAARGCRRQLRRHPIKPVPVAEVFAQPPFQVRVLPHDPGKVEGCAGLLRQEDLGQHFLETIIGPGGGIAVVRHW